MAKNIWTNSWIGLLLLCACKTATIYQNTTTLADRIWPADSLLNFSFHVQDTAQPYDIYLVVKNTQDYPYQNLYITYYLEDTTKKLLNTALKNYTLFEVKTGKPRGSGWGKVKNHEVIALQDYHFPFPGLYTLKLAQFMRTEALPGLHAVGIKVIAQRVSE
ncbi:MAG: gliding motility lipoprotein GldH [Bacteroidota bacterium]